MLPLAALALAQMISPAIAADAVKPPTLAKVTTNEGDIYVGELKQQNDTSVTIINLKTGHELKLNMSKVLRVDADVSDDAAANTVGLPTLLGWKISKLQLGGAKPTVGKIARITSAVIYTNLGTPQNIKPGDRLAVFHNEGAIKDPDSGKLLGMERSRIGELQVVEVQPTYSKAKRLGDLEVKLVEGDEVELAGFKLQVAVFPPVDGSGHQTDSGDALAEQLTTKLVNDGLAIVERSRLSAVITELAIQNTQLFDPKTAQKVGKQIGASAVLTGRIVTTGATSEAHMRLIKVETGQIILAASARLAGTAAAAADKTPATAAANAAPGDAALAQSMSSIKNWTVKVGAWKQSGQKLRGEGESMIDFNDDLPADSKISFSMNVVNGMRPRIYFDGPKIYIGNEGFSRNIWVYGEAAANLEGPHIEYENGQTLRVSIVFSGDTFELTVNNKKITGNCHRSDYIRMRMSAGDGTSKGPTEFWAFRVEPPAKKGPAK